MVVANNAFTGTLKYVTDYTGFSGDPALQNGNFLAVKISDIDPELTSVKIGLDPSMGSGLVEIINDPDKNGVFKVTDKNAQRFKVVVTDGETTTTKVYDLAGLTVMDSGV